MSEQIDYCNCGNWSGSHCRPAHCNRVNSEIEKRRKERLAHASALRSDRKREQKRIGKTKRIIVK